METPQNAVRKVLEAAPDVRLAVLYGSAAAGKMRADSDVDVALALGHPMSFQEKLDWTVRLMDAVRRDEVDVVDLESAGGLLLEQVLKKGRILVRRDEELYHRLVKRMWYFRADFAPLLERMLRERAEKFAHG